MKKCPKCHKNIPSNAKVCPYCGTPQSGYQPMKRTPKRKYAFIYPILIIALVFLPMGISYFFVFNALSDSGINQTATLKTYTKSNQETVVYQYDSLKEFSKNVKNSKKYVNKINNMESSLEKIVGTKNMDSEYLFQITDNNNLYVSVQYDISLDKQNTMSISYDYDLSKENIKKIKSEIFKINGKIDKTSKGLFGLKSSNDKKKNEEILKRNNLILDLKKEYLQLDTEIIRQKIVQNIDETSSLLDVLKLASSYYGFMARAMIKKNEEITDKEIGEEVKKVRDFINFSDFKVINNVKISDTKDLAKR